MHILNNMMKFLIYKSIFNYQMSYPNIKKKDDSIDSINICIDDINNENK